MNHARSLLELLHPDGFAAAMLAVGRDCPPSLLRDDMPPPTADAADLVLLAPDARECATQGWLAERIRDTTRRLTPDGVVYALVPRRWRRRARRLLEEAGLDVELVLAHLPNATETRHLAPVDARALKYLFSIRAPSRREELLQFVAARVPPWLLAAALEPIAIVARPAGARPVFEWLFQLDGSPARSGEVVVSRAWHARGGGVVLHVFRDRERRPTVVAKVRLEPSGAEQTARELAALDGPAAGATQAGAVVPRRVAWATVGERPVLVESAVPGRLAARLLRGRPMLVEGILALLVDWLARWSELTAAARPLTSAELEREILQPATEVAPLIDGGASYLAWLERRCEEAGGEQMPRVAVHNDLTMWNVLLDRDGSISIVDWEGAESAALPLTDFFYAATDAAAAVRRYADRLEGLVDCFTSGGRHAIMVSEMQARLCRTLGVTPRQAELCFHACWLRHAVDERRMGRESDRAPFLAIVEWAASRRERGG